MEEGDLPKGDNVEQGPLSELLVEDRVIEAPEEFKRAAVVTDDQPYRTMRGGQWSRYRS